MQDIYFISDMHFGHSNIIKYENRPFKNIKEMDATIIKNWNSVVKKDDKVFVLGDISFYDKEKTAEIIYSLNGYKVLILGNHDNERSLHWWKSVGFDEVINYSIIYNDFYILSHEPMYLNDNMPYMNIHGHIHNLKYESKQFFNVSVECIDYTPISFEKIKEDVVSKMKLEELK
ncbi:phosphoesterase [Tepidibacter hydrothermalis]|uniref:Phosphoesterase n=1 Tax=Tepidibacter hydrothermalis TaxID=3036126 RepID=A0ABY8E7W7_9FIRM|nr:phosphoesterase [Tepidibacter hydrothermalis]WFD08988.1 phosphoesterase [Tepidibacter hydrothermalis]